MTVQENGAGPIKRLRHKIIANKRIRATRSSLLPAPSGVEEPHAPTPRLRADKVECVGWRCDLNGVGLATVLTRPLATVLIICFNAVSGGSRHGSPNQYGRAGKMIKVGKMFRQEQFRRRERNGFKFGFRLDAGLFERGLFDTLPSAFSIPARRSPSRCWPRRDAAILPSLVMKKECGMALILYDRHACFSASIKVPNVYPFRLRKFWATSASSSLIPRMMTSLFLYSRCSFSRCGISATQGPHHDAQKLSSTALPTQALQTDLGAIQIGHCEEGPPVRTAGSLWAHFSCEPVIRCPAYRFLLRLSAACKKKPSQPPAHLLRPT